MTKIRIARVLNTQKLSPMQTIESQLSQIILLSIKKLAFLHQINSNFTTFSTNNNFTTFLQYHKKVLSITSTQHHTKKIHFEIVHLIFFYFLFHTESQLWFFFCAKRIIFVEHTNYFVFFMMHYSHSHWLLCLFIFHLFFLLTCNSTALHE